MAARSGPCGGLWVRPVAKPVTHITDIFVRPDIRRKRISVEVAATEDLEVHVQIDGTPFEVTDAAGTLTLEFPEHELWTPENPRLYTLRCVLLRDGKAVDSLSTRFGMREFTVKDNRFYFNNRPLFIKCVLVPPDCARGPASLDEARRDLELAKEAGFNMVRFSGAPPSRAALDFADEIGLLVYEDLPVDGREGCGEEGLRDTMLRDRHHASVAIWGIRAAPDAGDPGALRASLRAGVRSLDPSRLILDEAANEDLAREGSAYVRPYHDEAEPYDDLRIRRQAPLDRPGEQYTGNAGAPDRLSFLSEFGFGGMEDLPSVSARCDEEEGAQAEARFLREIRDAAEEGFAKRLLERVFGDFSGFAAATQSLQAAGARIQVDTVRANAKIAGYCTTQLRDSGREFCAGLLDRLGRPKPVFEAMKEAQAPLRTVIAMGQTNLVPRQTVPVTVTLLNERRLEDRANLSLQVVGPTNQVLWKKKREIKIPKSGKELWSGVISASGSAGTHQFVVRLMKGLDTLAENAVEFHVLDPVGPCGVGIHLLDPRGTWTKRCAALAKTSNIQAPIHIVPPLANTIRAYPDNELAQILGQVKEGAVALFFGPPQDWNDLADVVDPSIRATSRVTSQTVAGGSRGVYRYAKLHPVFDGLPARGLMGQAYRSTVAPRTFLETGEEDICGTFDTAPLASAGLEEGPEQCWGSDILVHGYGSGRIVFTHLRILEGLGEDPVAERLFVNMLRHFSRRAVPSGSGIFPVHQKSVEWLRTEREERVRHWRVIGPFPNWEKRGHETPYPPEEELDFEAVYPGWYTEVSWKDWYSTAENGHYADLQTALSPENRDYPFTDYGTAYAYAELNTVRRGKAAAVVRSQNAMKAWLNGRPLFEIEEPASAIKRLDVDTFLKQGRNTLLVKVSKTPGPFGFSIDFRPPDDTLTVKWWR